MAGKTPSRRTRNTGTAKKASPVRIRRTPLIDQLHPGILKTALERAGGDARKVEVISPTHATVRI